jgi:hypothetical protein
MTDNSAEKMPGDELVLMGTATPHMRRMHGLAASNLPNPPAGHSARIIDLLGVFQGEAASAEDAEFLARLREAAQDSQHLAEVNEVMGVPPAAPAQNKIRIPTREEQAEEFLQTKGRDLVRALIESNVHPGVARVFVRESYTRDQRFDNRSFDERLQAAAESLGFDSPYAEQAPAENADIQKFEPGA